MEKLQISHLLQTIVSTETASFYAICQSFLVVRNEQGHTGKKKTGILDWKCGMDSPLLLDNLLKEF